MVQKKSSLSELVRAQCRDYFRRDNFIRNGGVSKRVHMEYVFLNSKLLEGAGEIVGGKFAEKFIKEIGECIGYANSELDFFGESTYKTYKAEVLRNIAKKLYLSD